MWMVPLFAPLTLVACNETPARQTWPVSFNTLYGTVGFRIQSSRLATSFRHPKQDEANTRTRWKKGILGPTKVATSITEGDKTIACILETKEMVRKERGKVAWTLQHELEEDRVTAVPDKTALVGGISSIEEAKMTMGSSVQIRWWRTWNTPEWNSRWTCFPLCAFQKIAKSPLCINIDSAYCVLYVVAYADATTTHAV